MFTENPAEKSLLIAEEILEHERLTHAQKVQSLNNEIFVLNRLLASQHQRLEDLTGSDTPK